MDTPRVDIILRTFNHLDRTAATLSSLYEFTQNFNLVIVDNSDDLTEQYIKSLGKDNITYIRPDPPATCFNQVLNIGLKNSRSEFVIGMANTIVVEPDWLQPLVALLKQFPDVAIVQPKHLMPQGTIENAGIIFEAPMMHHQNIGVGEPGHRYTHVRPIHAAGFCCFAMRRKAVLPGFEEDYYIGWNGFDDVDACFALRQKAWRVMYCGYSTVFHYAHATRGNPNTWSEETWNKYNENKFRFLTRWAEWGEFKKE